MSYNEYTIINGLDLKTSETDAQPGTLRQARGCVFDTVGAVSSRYPRASITYAPTGKLRGWIEGVDASGVFIISKSGTDIYNDGALVTDSPAATATSERISGETHNGYVYYTDKENGMRRIKRGQTASEPAGLEAPDVQGNVPRTIATPTAGGSMVDGRYQYRVSFYNGIAESNLSEPIEDSVNGDQKGVTTSAGNNSVNLTDIPLGPPATTERRIYRTDVNGSAMYFIHRLEDNTTDTWLDTMELPAEAQPDATPGDDPTEIQTEADTVVEKTHSKIPWPFGDAEMTPWQHTIYARPETSEKPELVRTTLGYLADWSDHEPPPSDLHSLRFMSGTFWGIANDNEVWMSKTNNPEHWSPFLSFPVGRRLGEPLLAIEPIGEATMACYTASNIYTYSIVGDKASDGRLTQTESSVGIVGERAVAPVPLPGTQTVVHLFVARRGLYIFDGRTAQEASYRIESVFNDPSYDHYADPAMLTSATLGYARDRVWFSYSKGASNDRTILIDFQDPSAPRFTGPEHDGYSMFVHERSTRRLIGGQDGGVVWDLDATDDSVGEENVTWAVKTTNIPLVGKTIEDRVARLVLDADLAGLDTTVLVETPEGSSYTEVLTGTTVGRTRYRVRLPIHFQGTSVSVKLSSSSAPTRRHWFSFGLESYAQGVK